MVPLPSTQQSMTPLLAGPEYRPESSQSSYPGELEWSDETNFGKNVSIAFYFISLLTFQLSCYINEFYYDLESCFCRMKIEFGKH